MPDATPFAPEVVDGVDAAGVCVVVALDEPELDEPSALIALPLRFTGTVRWTSAWLPDAMPPPPEVVAAGAGAAAGAALVECVLDDEPSRLSPFPLRLMGRLSETAA